MEFDSFPRLTPTPIKRKQIDVWLGFNSTLPLRWIAGPAGSGKTTAAHLYARSCAHDVRYVRLSHGSTLSSFAASLERVLGAPVDPLRVVDAFPEDGRFELVVDDLDNANDEIRRVLQALPDRVPAHVTLIYISRSRKTIDAVSLVTQGLAVLMPATLLPFSAEDAANLCDALQITYAQTELNQLMYETEGWAFAVIGTLREAAYESHGLRGAFSRWHQLHGRLIQHLVERSLMNLSAPERAAAERIYAGEAPVNTPAHAHLHDHGLLLAFSESELRPLRAITPSIAQRSPAAEPATLPVAVIEMFGELEMTIDGRRVEWFRRRDRQIIAFLALQPEAKATRETILRLFWPDAEPHLAAQSLRTACSTIRRAIAQCVGYDRVDHYLTIGRELRLHTKVVTIISQRVLDHIRAAEEAYSDGNTAVARGHYLAACRLYKAPLLDDEREAWVEPYAQQFKEMIAIASQRSLEIRQSNRGENAPHPFAQTKMLFST